MSETVALFLAMRDPDRKRRSNRQRVAVASSAPTPGVKAGSGEQMQLVHALALPWCCQKGHDHAEIVTYRDGRTVCRRCETERRREHREANIDRERARDREYKRRKKAEAVARAAA